MEPPRGYPTQGKPPCREKDMKIANSRSVAVTRPHPGRPRMALFRFSWVTSASPRVSSSDDRRSSTADRWYVRVVEPTWQTSTGGSADSPRYIMYVELPGGVVSSHGSSLVPAAVTGLLPSAAASVVDLAVVSSGQAGRSDDSGRPSGGGRAVTLGPPRATEHVGEPLRPAGRGGDFAGHVDILVGGDAARVERVDVRRESVDDRPFLGLEGAEHPVPDDEDPRVVAVEVLTVRAVVDAVV